MTFKNRQWRTFVINYVMSSGVPPPIWGCESIPHHRGLVDTPMCVARVSMMLRVVTPQPCPHLERVTGRDCGDLRTIGSLKRMSRVSGPFAVVFEQRGLAKRGESNTASQPRSAMRTAEACTLVRESTSFRGSPGAQPPCKREHCQKPIDHAAARGIESSHSTPLSCPTPQEACCQFIDFCEYAEFKRPFREDRRLKRCPD